MDDTTSDLTPADEVECDVGNNYNMDSFLFSDGQEVEIAPPEVVYDSDGHALMEEEGPDDERQGNKVTKETGCTKAGGPLGIPSSLERRVVLALKPRPNTGALLTSNDSIDPRVLYNAQNNSTTNSSIAPTELIPSQAPNPAETVPFVSEARLVGLQQIRAATSSRSIVSNSETTMTSDVSTRVQPGSSSPVMSASKGKRPRPKSTVQYKAELRAKALAEVEAEEAAMATNKKDPAQPASDAQSDDELLLTSSRFDKEPAKSLPSDSHSMTSKNKTPPQVENLVCASAESPAGQSNDDEDADEERWRQSINQVNAKESDEDSDYDGKKPVKDRWERKGKKDAKKAKDQTAKATKAKKAKIKNKGPKSAAIRRNVASSNDDDDKALQHQMSNEGAAGGYRTADENGEDDGPTVSNGPSARSLNAAGGSNTSHPLTKTSTHTSHKKKKNEPQYRTKEILDNEDMADDEKTFVATEKASPEVTEEGERAFAAHTGGDGTGAEGPVYASRNKEVTSTYGRRSQKKKSKAILSESDDDDPDTRPASRQDSQSQKQPLSSLNKPASVDSRPNSSRRQTFELVIDVTRSASKENAADRASSRPTVTSNEPKRKNKAVETDDDDSQNETEPLAEDETSLPSQPALSADKIGNVTGSIPADRQIKSPLARKNLNQALVVQMNKGSVIQADKKPTTAMLGLLSKHSKGLGGGIRRPGLSKHGRVPSLLKIRGVPQKKKPPLPPPPKKKPKKGEEIYSDEDQEEKNDQPEEWWDRDDYIAWEERKRKRAKAAGDIDSEEERELKRGKNFSIVGFDSTVPGEAVTMGGYCST